MKPWMRALLWLGLGGGVGFFIGEQVGERRAEKEREEERRRYTEDVRIRSVDESLNEYEAALNEYRGYVNDTYSVYPQPDTDDIPEMPTEEDIAIDPDIPQLHPTMFEPEVIGEEEYNANIWGYDLENLILYQADDVLYNETKGEPVENPDYVIGVGTLAGFGGDPNNPVETIYVKSKTYGKLFRIDRVDGAFTDLVDGQIHPEDDEPEEDDSEEVQEEANPENEDDGFWNDV